MARIRGVLFDYGLVLSGPPDLTAWGRMREMLSSSEEDFHAAYWRPRLDYDRGVLKGDAYWQVVAKELGKTPTPGLLRELKRVDVEVWTQPNREMIAWAGALQAHGLRTAILSNLGDDMELGVRDRCAWLSAFDHLTFSHRLGTAKPDPAIYSHAAEGMALAPGEILFVDDREENIAAAKAFGMQALPYLDHAAFVDELRMFADFQPSQESEKLGNRVLPLPAGR